MGGKLSTPAAPAQVFLRTLDELYSVCSRARQPLGRLPDRSQGDGAARVGGFVERLDRARLPDGLRAAQARLAAGLDRRGQLVELRRVRIHAWRLDRLDLVAD